LRPGLPQKRLDVANGGGPIQGRLAGRPSGIVAATTDGQMCVETNAMPSKVNVLFRTVRDWLPARFVNGMKAKPGL
jgi:hypothetical protein